MTYSKAFEDSFKILIGHEGNFKREAADHADWDSNVVTKGNLVGTKYGISAGSYPREDIPNLSLDRAKELYYRDYWQSFRGDDLDPKVAFQLFDADVNHGKGNGTRMLQRALGVNDDGIIGPVTWKSLKDKDPELFIMALIAERIEFFTKISTWDKYGKGWMRRMAGNLRVGAK